MRSLFFAILFIAFSNSAFAKTKIHFHDLNQDAIEMISRGDDIEVVSINPTWSCGPCDLYNFLGNISLNEDRAFDARTIIGRFFSREVTFNSIKVYDFEAQNMGLEGYPSTAIFVEGEFMGLFTGAISLTQLGEVMDRLTKKDRFRQRAYQYLSN